jgi:hypothetical protein
MAERRPLYRMPPELQQRFTRHWEKSTRLLLSPPESSAGGIETILAKQIANNPRLKKYIVTIRDRYAKCLTLIHDCHEALDPYRVPYNRDHAEIFEDQRQRVEDYMRELNRSHFILLYRLLSGRSKFQATNGIRSFDETLHSDEPQAELARHLLGKIIYHTIQSMEYAIKDNSKASVQLAFAIPKYIDDTPTRASDCKHAMPFTFRTLLQEFGIDDKSRGV